MTIKAVLDWQNPDSTQDINSRYQALFTRGVLTGGVITTVSGQLKVSLLPFTSLSYDGMLVSEDASTLLDIPLDQTTVIALYARHLIGDPAIAEVVAIEATTFNGLIDRDYYTVFGAVTTITPATEVVDGDISYSLREMQDKRTRDKLRGQVNDTSELPLDPTFNVYGDIYVVYSGVGVPPNLYAWDGVNWDNITGANAVAASLLQHRLNLDTTEMYIGEPVEEVGRIHLSNYQKDAALGSYGTPSIVNRYVTEDDPRIPTDTPDGGQSAALLGTHGTPSNLNRYVTAEYPIAAPTVLSGISWPDNRINMSTHGPVYVGRGAIDSANIYFSLLDPIKNRGYLNSVGLPCKVNAVYKSIVPLVKLDPSTDPLVDSYGFYNGAILYLGIDYTIDTDSRLVYGKKTFFSRSRATPLPAIAEINHGFPVVPTPSYEIISGTLLSSIANIKGRSFDDPTPTLEQNINLRIDLDSLSAYIGSVMETNVVAGNEDFIRLAPPAFGGIFDKNVGVDYVFSFENTGLVEFEYDSVTGIVHYYSPVNLLGVTVGDLFIDAKGNKYEVFSIGVNTVGVKNIGSLPPIYPSTVRGAYPESVSSSVDASIIHRVVLTFENTSLVPFNYSSVLGRVQYTLPVVLAGVNVGDLFRDGSGTKYDIYAVNDGADNLDIRNIHTGLIPSSIDTSIGNSLDGSAWVNNNPRDLLLSEMKLNFGAEFVPIKKLVRKVDEYSEPDGQIAFGVVRYDNRFEERIVFYGSWENYTTPEGESYVRNTDGFGRFEVTGYFTDVLLVTRKRQFSSWVNVLVNGITNNTVDPTEGGSISGDVTNVAGIKYTTIKLNASSLDDSIPSDLIGYIPMGGGDSFDIFGFVFIRNTTQALLESGRAFESARIIRRDMPDTSVAIDTVPYQGRGGRLVYAVENNTHARVITTLTDMDSNGTPSGTWTGSTINITSSGGKVPFYSAGDIIAVRSSASITLCRILTITLPNTIQVDSPTGTGSVVNLLHVCSTNSNIPLGSQESQIARYILPDDFISHTPTDLGFIHQLDRFVVGSDGLTVISGQSVLVTNVNVIGTKKAVQIQQGSAGKLRFSVLATRMDLLCVNNASTTVYISIDGSSEYSITLSAVAKRVTIFSNARYQAHEVTIRVTVGNFSIAEMMLFGPRKPEFAADSLGSFPNTVADLSQLAKYQPSAITGLAPYTDRLKTAPDYFPVGAIFKEALSNMTYINSSTGIGDAWSFEMNYTKSIYGPYVNTTLADASAKFEILGTAFELQFITGPDHGYFTIEVDGVDIASIPAATIVGNYSGGYVDGYSALYGRNNVGVFGLSYGVHTVTITLLNPRNKNISSADYKMAFVGFYHCNDNGLLTCGIDNYGVYTSVSDIRLFNPLETKPLDTDVQVTDLLSRAGKVNLVYNTTSIVVNLALPYKDADYVVMCTFVNDVDSSPLFQPYLISSQSGSSFTISWNDPIPNSNYGLHYFTQSTDV